MTRCGIPGCTLPTHQNEWPRSARWTYRGEDITETITPVRIDPGYDQPGPPRRSDLSLVVIVQGIVVFLAIVLFCFLASLVEVGS